MTRTGTDGGPAEPYHTNTGLKRRDIARQCETAGRSPLKRNIANHTETPNRRRATRGNNAPETKPFPVEPGRGGTTGSSTRSGEGEEEPAVI